MLSKYRLTEIVMVHLPEDQLTLIGKGIKHLKCNFAILKFGKSLLLKEGKVYLHQVAHTDGAYTGFYKVIRGITYYSPEWDASPLQIIPNILP